MDKVAYYFDGDDGMYNFSVLKNRPILSKYDLCIIGNLTHCVFDENLSNIAYFLCIKDGVDFLIKTDCILSFDDAIVVGNRECIISAHDMDFTSLKTVADKEVYLDNGHHIGKVTDIVFDAKGKVAKLVVDDLSLKTSDVAGVGDILLVKSNSKKPKKAKRVDILSLATEDKPVAILDGDNLLDATTSLEDGTGNASDNITAPQPTEQPQWLNQSTSQSADGSVVVSVTPTLHVAGQKTQVPPRIISDYNFLLGRNITENIYSYNGELIAYKDTPVTVAIVDKARTSGKLLELTLHSK